MALEINVSRLGLHVCRVVLPDTSVKPRLGEVLMRLSEGFSPERGFKLDVRSYETIGKSLDTAKVLADALLERR